MDDTRISTTEEVETPKEVAPSEDFGDWICRQALVCLSYVLVVLTLPMSLLYCLRVVEEYERAIIFRLGRSAIAGEENSWGLVFTLPCVDEVHRVDLRTRTFDVPPQEVLTKDFVTVAVDAVVFYRICDPLMSVTNVENVHRSTRVLAQTTLRNILGTKSLSEILLEREEISGGMQETLDSATGPWGVQVERVEIKDVRLPQQLQRAMAAEAEASREARAQVIAAQGELMSSHALRQASDVLSVSPLAMHLRYLLTLTSIAAEKSSTILYPVPMDVFNLPPDAPAEEKI